MRRIGIMGGTFDPIHYGHLLIAEQAREAFGLDRVFFVPNGQPAHKKAYLVSSANDRYAMCALATTAHPQFLCSKVEVEREGPSYAIDTVRHFQKSVCDLDRIFFITGADAVLEILTWHDYQHLIAECEFIAATRPRFVLENLHNVLNKEFLNRVHFLSIPGLDISSTEIRKRVRMGKSIRYLTPGPVRRFIFREGLYVAGPTTEDTDDTDILDDLVKG